MITENNLDEAIQDYKIVLAWVQSEGGNPIVGMMEHGYSEQEAKFIADKFLESLKK